MGAAGLGLAGIAGARAVPAGAAESVTSRGIHVHGTLLVLDDGPGGPAARASTTFPEFGVNLNFVVSMEVWGPDSDLSGLGWGALADLQDPKQPTRVDVTQRLYTQRGSIEGDIVRLRGRMLFSYVPGDAGGPILTEANLATGHIRFTAGNTATSARLEGTGIVMRV
ncbi:MAG TPA: hypothetical protein VHV82_02095 [Sporichthyaceae bacterium]|jgi:hypothetical protein|nr:hypothetical protein [Sporichthyaceae bacterium]